MLQNEIVQFRCGFDNVNLFLAKFFFFAVILIHRSYIKERSKKEKATARVAFRGYQEGGIEDYCSTFTGCALSF